MPRLVISISPEHTEPLGFRIARYVRLHGGDRLTVEGGGNFFLATGDQSQLTAFAMDVRGYAQTFSRCGLTVDDPDAPPKASDPEDVTDPAVPAVAM